MAADFCKEELDSKNGVSLFSVERLEMSDQLIVIYSCIHGKYNPWDYVTMTSDVRLFKVRRAYFPHHQSIGFILTRHKLSATAKILKLWFSENCEIQFYEKHRQLLPRKQQTFKHHQMTSNLNQLQFVAFALYQQQLKILSLLSPTKATRERGRFLKVKQVKFPSVLLLTKAVKGENKTPKFKPVQTPLNY